MFRRRSEYKITLRADEEGMSRPGVATNSPTGQLSSQAPKSRPPDAACRSGPPAGKPTAKSAWTLPHADIRAATGIVDFGVYLSLPSAAWSQGD